MKKVLAAIVALALLVTVFSAISFAEDFDFFIDFSTEEGRSYGTFDAVDPDTRYHEENDWFVRIRNKTADDQDANEFNGGIYNNKFFLTFNSKGAGKAYLTIKTRMPDSKYGAFGYILGVLVNSNDDDDFELYDVEDLGESKSDPFDYDEVIVDVKEGENKIAFIQLQGSGTGGNGWSIEFLSIGLKFTGDAGIIPNEPVTGGTGSGIINDSDYSVSYVIDKTNAKTWTSSDIGENSVTYFLNAKDEGLEVAVRAIGLGEGDLVQMNFNPGNKLWSTTGQFVSFKLGETLTVLQHNHKNGLLDDDSAGGADITSKVTGEIAPVENGYEFKVTLPKEIFTITDVEGAADFVYGQDDLYFGMFLVAGGGGYTNQSVVPGGAWTCEDLGLNEYKISAVAAPTEVPTEVPTEAPTEAPTDVPATDVPATDAPTADAQPTENVPAETTDPGTKGNDETKSNLPLIIGIIAAVVVVAAIIGIVIGVNKKKKK